MIQNIKLNFRAIKVVLTLARMSERPLNHRFNILKKYYSFYIHHSRLQQAKFHQNLTHNQQEIAQQAYGQRIKTVYAKYSERLKTQYEQKFNQLKSKQASSYEQQAQTLLRSGMSYLSLYYESLQNMIEGRRQVLHDSSFKFEDGKTVEEKRMAFERYLSRLLGRKQEQIDRIQEEYQRKKKRQDER